MWYGTGSYTQIFSLTALCARRQIPRPLTVTVANPRWLDDDEDGPHVNHSSTPDACGERHAIGGHRRPRRGTSMLCDRHQRLRLLPSCRLGGTVMKPQIAVFGLRGRATYIYGNRYGNTNSYALRFKFNSVTLAARHECAECNHSQPCRWQGLGPTGAALARATVVRN